MTIETFDSSVTWTCPTGVSTVQSEEWGYGGNGGSNGSQGGMGGGGGAYAKSNSVATVPGNNYTVNIAYATDTYFQSSVIAMAKSGQSGLGTGQGGQASASVGDTKFSGGNGAAGSGTTGGGGGSSAGTAANGNTATSSTGASAPTGGGAGGNGGLNNNFGAAGVSPGGGAGGGGGNMPGNAGAAGRVRLTYTVSASSKSLMLTGCGA